MYQSTTRELFFVIGNDNATPVDPRYIGKIVIVGENVLGGKYWAGGVKFSRNLKKRKHFLKKEEIRKMESRNGERE